MRKMFTILVIAILSSFFAMCTKKDTIPVESSWAVEKVYVEGSQIQVPQDHSPYLAFLRESKISGETGCNRFFGDFTVKGKKLTFSNVGSTRMMCPNMAFENAWLGAISNTAEFSLQKNTLTLKDSNGNIIAVLLKKEPSAMEN